MSIVFIFSGLLFLLCVFDLIKFSNKVIKVGVMCLSILLMLSYFVGDLDIFKVHINLLQFICIFLFLSLFAVNTLSLLNVLQVILVLLVYKFLLDQNLNYLVVFESVVINLFIICFSLVCSSGLKSGILFVTFLSIAITFVSGFVGFDSFGYLMIDFTIVFESILLYLISYLLMFSAKSNFNLSTRSFYVQKNDNRYFIANVWNC